MLAQFTDTEELDGEIYHCEKCNAKRKKDILYTKAEKRLLIKKLPPVLRLHLKRFRWSGRLHREKIHTPAMFDEVLDMGPFCDCKSDTNTGNVNYRLTGVVIHHGTGFKSGHYTANCWNSEAETTSNHQIDINTEITTTSNHQIDIYIELTILNYQIDINTEITTTSNHQIDIYIEITTSNHQIHINTEIETTSNHQMDINTEIKTTSNHQIDIYTEITTTSNHQIDIYTEIETTSNHQIDINTEIKTTSNHQIDINTEITTTSNHQIDICRQ
ncbi:USP44_49 [Mytilus edulis]|uniref:USP44_49 n=1 Tax=Mytilus edulis TaxID=6550 RepID=A0A8S3PPK9_MYTED|nr:USP44_49 [Mytilus edulis]